MSKLPGLDYEKHAREQAAIAERQKQQAAKRPRGKTVEEATRDAEATAKAIAEGRADEYDT